MEERKTVRPVLTTVSRPTGNNNMMTKHNGGEKTKNKLKRHILTKPKKNETSSKSGNM